MRATLKEQRVTTTRATVLTPAARPVVRHADHAAVYSGQPAGEDDQCVCAASPSVRTRPSQALGQHPNVAALRESFFLADGAKAASSAAAAAAASGSSAADADAAAATAAFEGRGDAPSARAADDEVPRRATSALSVGRVALVLDHCHTLAAFDSYS